jgi:hypothetical protein
LCAVARHDRDCVMDAQREWGRRSARPREVLYEVEPSRFTAARTPGGPRSHSTHQPLGRPQRCWCSLCASSCKAVSCSATALRSCQQLSEITFRVPVPMRTVGTGEKHGGKPSRQHERVSAYSTPSPITQQCLDPRPLVSRSDARRKFRRARNSPGAHAMTARAPRAGLNATPSAAARRMDMGSPI